MIIDVRHLLPSGSGFTGRYDLALAEVIRRVWHHTVSHISWNTAANATQDEEIAHLIAIDLMHAAWSLNGIGYHNAAFASGRAYQVGSYDKARAHVASGQNSYSIGTVLIGNLTDSLPSEGHMAAAKECKRSIEDFYRRNLEGLPHLLVPGQSTACPGARWSEWVPLLEKGEEEMAFTEQDRATLSSIFERSRSALVKPKGRPEVYEFNEDEGRLIHLVGLAVFNVTRHTFDDVQELPTDHPIWKLPVTYPGGIPNELR